MVTSFKNYKTNLQMTNSRMQLQFGWLHNTRFLVMVLSILVLNIGSRECPMKIKVQQMS